MLIFVWIFMKDGDFFIYILLMLVRLVLVFWGDIEIGDKNDEISFKKQIYIVIMK